MDILWWQILLLTLYAGYQILDELQIYSSLSAPVFAGLFAGLVMGDLKAGLIIGGSGDSGRSVIGSGIPDADSNGYRTLPMSAGVATITIPYSVAASSVYGKKNMTGIVIAAHVESN